MQFKHIKLSHNLEETMFIIFYNHYMLKISELKNQMPKLRFKIWLIIGQFDAKSNQGVWDWRFNHILSQITLFYFILKCIHMYILEKYSKMKFTIFSFEQNMKKITMVI